MNKNVLLIFLLFQLCELRAQTPEQVTCPPGILKVDFVVPGSENKKVFCLKQENGKNVQHGQELIFSPSGNLLSKKYFIDGQESAEPQATPKYDLEKMSDAVFRILSLFNGTNQKNEQGFSVANCPNTTAKWIKMALTKSSEEFSYGFSEKCDVRGKFTAKMGEVFPLSMELRNLENFNKTEIDVIIKMEFVGSAVTYKFLTNKGVLISDTEKVEFAAKYEKDFDLMTKQHKPNTESGQITIIKINNNEVNHTKSLAPLLNP